MHPLNLQWLMLETAASDAFEVGYYLGKWRINLSRSSILGSGLRRHSKRRMTKKITVNRPATIPTSSPGTTPPLIFNQLILAHCFYRRVKLLLIYH